MEYAIKGRLAVFFDSNLKLNFIKEPLVVIEENKIIEIDSYNKAKQSVSGHDMIGDENQLIIPGLINCHTHLAMTIFRGLADDLPLDIWLREHIWPLENKLKANDVYYGAKLGALESIASGVTTVNSMYWYPSDEAKALEETGMRGYIGAPVITGISTLNEATKIIEEHHNTIENRIRVSLSLHSPYTVTIDEFQESSRYLKEYNQISSNPKLLLHTHLAESSTEMKDSKEFNLNHNQNYPDVGSPTELLDEIGVLDENLLAAHCIHLNEKDIQIFRKSQSRISLNPLSNAKLGNHMPPIPDIINELENVGLGTDGPASNNTLDLFDTIRFLSLYYKGYHNNPTLIKSREVFKLATIGGEKAINWKGIGTLEKSSIADIITINLKKPHLTPNNFDEALVNHFAYSMKGNDVENVIIDGKLVYGDRIFADQNPDDISNEVNRIAYSLISEES